MLQIATVGPISIASVNWKLVPSFIPKYVNKIKEINHFVILKLVGRKTIKH